MDWMLVAGIVAVGAIMVVVVLVMLNRAWGDFPGRISGLPPAQPPSPGQGQPPLAGPPAIGELSAGAPAGGLVPVTHPLIRQAILTAMARGGTPYATYFIKDGEAVYLVPGRIADPQQRENMTRLFASINSGDSNSISFSEVIRVVQEMTKK